MSTDRQSRTSRRMISVLAASALLAGLLAGGSAQAQASVGADLAMVQDVVKSGGLQVTSVPTGTTVRFAFVAKDLGPSDIPDGDSFDVGIARATGLSEFYREVCVLGPSPDTPDCEYGPMPVGQRVQVTVRIKVVGPPGTWASMRMCVFAENGFPDPDPYNNCRTTQLLITT